MTAVQLEELFLSHGYYKIPSNLPEFVFYCHREMQAVNVIHVIDYRHGLYISDDQYFHRFFQAEGGTGSSCNVSYPVYRYCKGKKAVSL